MHAVQRVPAEGECGKGSWISPSVSLLPEDAEISLCITSAWSWLRQ